jgi:hypothetical protein
LLFVIRFTAGRDACRYAIRPHHIVTISPLSQCGRRTFSESVPMKQLLPLCVVVCLAAVARGGPAESAIMAAMRLSDQPNYSWVATVLDDARTYDIHGKTNRDGYSRVKMPMINSVRRRLGRSVMDTDIEAIFKGNQRCVLHTDEGWKKVDELPWYTEEEPPDFGGVRTSPRGGKPSMGIPAGTHIPSSSSIGAHRGSSRRGSDDEEPRYSNLQLGITHPHEDLGVIVSSHQDWVVDADGVSGTLTDLGAQLLLVRDGQKEIEPRRAAGTFKLWIRDGMVVKYTVKLEGVLSVQTKMGRRNVEVHQTVNTTLKDIGTTRFEVPDEARRKLGS